MADSSRKSTRGVATSWQEVSCILYWLEIDEKNFNLITGGGQKDAKGVVTGQKLKKNDAYKLLADYINARFHKKWDWKVVSTRYRSVFKKYTATKRAFMDVSGKKFGLTVEEVARGVTIDQKLDSMCHGYRRWDALFGTRQNVNPSYSLESVDSDDEEEENDGNEENDSFDDEISNSQISCKFIA
jgi:hypothetical protein